MHRVLEQPSFLIDQAEVNAPCIDADALDLPALLCFDQPLLDLKEKTEHIPVHGPVQDDRVIGKPVQLFDGDLLSVKSPAHCPAARSTEVKCQYFLFHNILLYLWQEG